MKRFRPAVEELHARLMPTLVFIFNGDGLAEAEPDYEHTQLAADQLSEHGDRSVQMPTPAMNSVGAFYQLADEIRAISKGQPIGLMGFSAGGTLAMRLSGVANLNVRAVLSYYGPPDLRDWLNYHHGDRYYQWVTGHVQLTTPLINILSGPSPSHAYIDAAFGLKDHNVVSSVSTADFEADFPDGHVYAYDGPHRVSLFADYPAFKDFVSHL